MMIKLLLMQLGIYLENEGYKVFKAYNGKEAIEIIEENLISI